MITYSSGSNWYICFNFVSLLTVSFANSPFITIDTAIIAETVVQWCSDKKMFLEISQNSQEHSCAKDLFLMKQQMYRVNNFIKKRFWHKYFLVNSAKFLIKLV